MPRPRKKARYVPINIVSFEGEILFGFFYPDFGRTLGVNITCYKRVYRFYHKCRCNAFLSLDRFQEFC